ncbi:MAG: phenylalanine--tRNA ligase subunit alpha [Armatimonadetes bacterium]|nr:phenylalanine--tRNA ligase subunit alpha [Armatimonadota bacterium]
MDETPVAEIGRLTEEATKVIEQAGSEQELEHVRVAYAGREGKLTKVLRGIGKLPAELRPQVGQEANRAREVVEAAIEQRRQALAKETAAGKGADALDVTLPGRGPEVGHRHPLMTTIEHILDIFVGMGYSPVLGPEVEWCALNWTALNYPPDHPAMDEQDSFYITDDILLRTHTSPAQIRAMRARHDESCPVRSMDWRDDPLTAVDRCECTPAATRAVVPGRTYRRESVTLTHHDIFYQLECLLVDEGITFAHLKGTLATFLRAYLGPSTRVRFRPDFFPFTEPSADFSVNCDFCDAQGCRFCKDSGWVEIGGSGLVHPNVLRAGGYNPDKVSGFAFGFGLERLAQRRFGIPHIRTLYENDLRFLRQF